MNEKRSSAGSLSTATLREAVGPELFDSLLRAKHPDFPHEISTRLWYEGDESFDERLRVAVEVYRLLPGYGHLMYWRYSEFDERTRVAMWEAYRTFLGDPSDEIAKDVAYSLWVDYFEDDETVERAWREVSGPQEPRRPRLDRVIRASGPVPWHLKAPLYEALATEGGWDDALVEALYGSCIDVYGHLERVPAQHLLRRLKNAAPEEMAKLLERALADPKLPSRIGWERLDYLFGRKRD
jgi:hypothetical protein